MARVKKISVIIPAFNAERCIAKCLDSVVQILGEQVECLVIDDGSTDKTPAIIKRFTAFNENIKYIVQNNCGVSAARNTGIENAEGEYLLFIDSDDYFADEFIFNICELAENMKEDLAILNYCLVYENQIHKVRFQDKIVNNTIADVEKLIMSTSDLNACWGRLFKKEVIDQFKIRFNEQIIYGEDLQFMIDFLKNLKSVVFKDINCICYIQHFNSSMFHFTFFEQLNFIQLSNDIRMKYLDEKCKSNLKSDVLQLNFKVFSRAFMLQCIIKPWKEVLNEYKMIKKNKSFFSLLRKSRKHLNSIINYLEFISIFYFPQAGSVFVFKVKAEIYKQFYKIYD